MGMISVHDLWKKYGDHEVLKGLNLEMQEGETVVILGRSGVGKSVLLRQIMGLEKPDQGYIEVASMRVSELKGAALYQALRGMGMLFQGSALFDSLTVGENVCFYLRQHGDPATGQHVPERQIQEIIRDALHMVGLEGTEHLMPSSLSGGMRRRAALARVIAYRPHILLYDEPTTGLDPITAMQINELIVATQRELKATSLVVTHDIRSALEVGDRLALHHEGKIVYIADTATFIKSDHPLIKSFMEYSLAPAEGNNV
jgi:phospholipid/cholesterol/gamma-HCH transport system ATP-binding protein